MGGTRETSVRSGSGSGSLPCTAQEKQRHRRHARCLLVYRRKKEALLFSLQKINKNFFPLDAPLRDQSQCSCATSVDAPKCPTERRHAHSQHRDHKRDLAAKCRYRVMSKNFECSNSLTLGRKLETAWPFLGSIRQSSSRTVATLHRGTTCMYDLARAKSRATATHRPPADLVK